MFFQTYSDKTKIPNEIYKTIEKYAPEYQHIILDDEEGKIFLQEYFTPIVLQTFNALKLGAHKADLLRYCLLYVFGGVYMDISTELIMKISDIFVDKTTLYIVLSTAKNSIHQAIISSPPNKRIFLSLINHIINTQNPKDYHEFCKDFLNEVNKDLKSSIQIGFNISENGNKYYLMTEECSYKDKGDDGKLCDGKFDKYGYCCLTYDNNVPVIKNRRPSYPWK